MHTQSTDRAVEFASRAFVGCCGVLAFATSCNSASPAARPDDAAAPSMADAPGYSESDVGSPGADGPAVRPDTCDAGLTACFGSSCVDLQTDPHNCGRCDRDCSGFRGGCAQGACQPAPVTIVASDASADFPGSGPIVTDGVNVYWTVSGLIYISASGAQRFAGRVMQAPVDGGAAITLAVEPQAASCTPMDIAVSGGSVYWTTPYEPDGGAGSGTVETTPVEGGTPMLLASVAHGWPLSGIAVDSSRVYWGTTDSILALALDGGAPLPLVSTGAQSIAVDSANLYWATGTLPGAMARMPLDGGAQTTIATMQDTPVAIAVDGMNIYWATLDSATTWSINASPTDGGPLTTVASNFVSFLIDSGNLYAWTGGNLVRLPLAGGSATTLAVVGPGMECGQSTAPAAPPLAIDATNVYWVDPEGSVMKVPK